MIYKNFYFTIVCLFVLTISCNSATQPAALSMHDTLIESSKNIVDTPTINKPLETITVDTLIFPDNEKSTVEILQVGKLSADEVDKSAAKKEWTGLYKIGSMFFMRQTKLEILPATDTIDNTIKPALLVSTSIFNNCIILMSGLSVKDKDLLTAVKSKDTIFPGEEMNVKLKNNNYQITATGIKRINTDGSFGITNYKLFLNSNINGVDIKQMLVSQPVLENKMVTILWMGDIDGDQKLDLIINASPNKGYSTPALYLSAKAEVNDLVKFAGQHIASK